MSNQKNAQIPVFSRSSGKIETPAAPYGYALGVRGETAALRLTLVKRVVTGSWRKPDGTRGENYSWWCSYSHNIVGKALNGYTLVGENEMIRVMSFEAFVERKAAA